MKDIDEMTDTIELLKKGIKKLQNQARNKVFGKDTKSLQHS